MNCVDLFLSQARANPKKTALWLPDSGVTSFGELLSLSERAQKVLRENHVKPGDSILLLEGLGPKLYASVIGALGMGVSVVLVEPWMPIQNINHVVKLVRPKIFLTALLGRFWGMRVPAIREIPKWVSTSQIDKATATGFHVEGVEYNTRGIITFTSGTTGKPKGVLRNQGYMIDQHRVLADALDLDKVQGTDLCIFANFVLANLASGRGSVIVPAQWKGKYFEAIDSLPQALKPESLTCGPAFLLEMMKQNIKGETLQSIHVGGALTDRWIFEKGFERWPKAHWTHVYGSSEAEPVAICDAKVSVEQSKKRGYFQTLNLGHPVSSIKSQVEKDGAWVTGPHVCPQYLGNDEENRLYKKRDDQGQVWHFMGDRVIADEAGWWYAGRSGQLLEDFQLEQKIYSYLESSKSFIVRDKSGQRILVGENLKFRSPDLKRNFSEISNTVETHIYRDKRHRARIDRAKSLKKGAPWIVG